MRCKQVTAWMSAYIDGQIDDEQRRAFEAHIAACGQCRDELAALRTTVDVLRAVEPVEAPANLAQRVRAGIQEASPAVGRDASGQRNRWVLFLSSAPLRAAAAAGIMLMLVFVAVTRLAPEEQGEVVRVAAPARRELEEDAATVSDHKAEAWAAMAETPERAAPAAVKEEREVRAGEARERTAPRPAPRTEPSAVASDRVAEEMARRRKTVVAGRSPGQQAMPTGALYFADAAKQTVGATIAMDEDMAAAPPGSREIARGLAEQEPGEISALVEALSERVTLVDEERRAGLGLVADQASSGSLVEAVMTEAAFARLRDTLAAREDIWWQRRGTANGLVQVWLRLPEVSEETGGGD